MPNWVYQDKRVRSRTAFQCACERTYACVRDVYLPSDNASLPRVRNAVFPFCSAFTLDLVASEKRGALTISWRQVPEGRSFNDGLRVHFRWPTFSSRRPCIKNWAVLVHASRTVLYCASTGSPFPLAVHASRTGLYSMLLKSCQWCVSQ